MKHNSPNWQKEFYPRSQVLTLAQHPLEGWNRKLFRNVGNEPTHTAQQPRITKISNNFFNSWFLASWINVNKIVQLDATICRHLFTAKSLYMFRASQHPSSGALKSVTATSDIGHNTGTATSSPDQTTLEGSSCTIVMTYTRGSGYNFLVLLIMGAVTPETCRVTLQ